MSWNTLCPEYRAGNASDWTIWDSSVDDIAFCYLEIFSGIAHAIFLVVNAFNIGRIGIRTPQENFTSRISVLISAASWIIRFILCLSTVILTLLSLFLQLSWLGDSSAYGIISFVNFGICLFSWLVHACIAFNMSKSHRSSVDTISVLLSWFPVFLVSSLQLRSVFLGHYANDVHRIITMVFFGCQLVYLFSIGLQIFSSCLYIEPSISPSATSESSSDRDHLLDEMPNGLPMPRLGRARMSGFFKQLLFLWVDPLMQHGAAGQLNNAGDLFELPSSLKADQHADRVKQRLLEDNKSSSVYLPKILFKLWGKNWLALGAMKFTYSFLQYTSPLFVDALVSVIENPGSKPGYYSYLYGSGLVVVNLISAFIQLHYVFFVEKLALCIRGALIDTIFGKLLKVHSSALSAGIASGQVVNLVGTDCQKVAGNCQYLHQLWALPLQVCVALYLLYRQVGFAFIGGLVFTILLIPLNQFLASKISKQVEENLKQRDLRVKLMGEALNAIRVIKFHAWEKWFSNRVGAVRSDEMKTVKTIKYLDAWCVYFWATTPLIMAVLTFTTYVLMGNTLTASKVFTCLSVFGLVIVPLNAIPWIITGTVEAWISAKRLQKFLKITEINLNSYYAINANSAEAMMTIDRGVFSWSSESDEAASHQLRNVKLSIKKGDLIGVIGRVGSGKSSLLNAIMAEMYLVDGHMTITQDLFTHGFSYVPQDNWIQQGTIQSNIKFSSEDNDAGLYQKVISACALSEDMNSFSAGDLTQIGENGVTLSGGQKARVALARAVYQNKELILLDDPLSAVDAHVANHIFDECIMKLLAGKTRVLVTHHVEFLRAADLVIVMKDGQISEMGPPGEVLSHLRDSEFEGNTSQSEAESDMEETKTNVATPLVRKKSRSGGKKSLVPQLISDEQREFGTVKLNIWKKYWKAVGNFWGISVFVSLILMQVSYNVTDWWLSYWVAHEKTYINPVTNKTESDYKFYLSVYGGIGAGNSFFAFVRSFVFAFAGIQAAYRMHDNLLFRVMRGKLSFFDTTPSGRILNRFAQDVTSVDGQLPFMLNILLACIFQLLGTLIVICYGLPWFTLVLIPIAPLYYFIQRFYRSTSREIKRINTLTQSPIYTMYSETVSGLTTIRAMRAEKHFYEKYKQLLDDHLRAQFSDMASHKWLDTRLQLFGVVIIAGVVLIALMIKSSAGVLGLTVSYSLTVIGVLNNFVTSLIETEKEMVSVERITQYLEDIEEENYDGALEPPASWPNRGAVEFRNISLRYRDDLPDALSDVSLAISPGQRTGIVGRTGAGKSSFLTTLFRTTEIYKGEITIDGIDIQHVPLGTLRSRLALIPQTPSIFDASVRSNIDPLSLRTDEELWRVIDMCHLRPAVEKLGGTLEAGLGENGRKLSLGQKQLMCLARALLIKAKIICMDEATASVDYETDTLIQTTLREAFSDSTLITIAHRLQTIMDYNRVVVMSSGKVVEYDEPKRLLNLPGSAFAAMNQQNQRAFDQ